VKKLTLNRETMRQLKLKTGVRTGPETPGCGETHTLASRCYCFTDTCTCPSIPGSKSCYETAG
jgi:hypothetical protein